MLSRRATLGLALSLTLGCSAGVWRTDAAPPEHLRAVAAAPFAETAMPYQGQGYVGILNNGLLVIEAGGELVYDPATDEYVPSPMETVVYRVNTSNLNVAEFDGEVFLDRNGADIRHRNVPLERVLAISFATLAESAREQQAERYAVLDFTGQMIADFDAATKTLTLAVVDQDTGRRFSLQAPVRGAPNVGQAADAGGVVLLPADDGGGPPCMGDDCSWVSSCTVDCSGGSCTISCISKGSLCYCKTDGTPVCSCRRIPAQ